MKYTLEGFSQEAALSMQATVTENGEPKTIKLDIIDLNILRWFVDFYPVMKKTIIDGKEYAWLDYTAFIEDMPLLSLSNQSLYKRCRKMVQLGILTHKTVRAKGTFSYYGFGPKYQLLIHHNAKATAPKPAAQAPAVAQDPWADATGTNTEQSQLPIATPEPQPTPQPKKTRKTKSFDAIIDSYTNDPTTKELLGEWLQNRKATRGAMTDNAIKRNIDTLDQCAADSHMTVNDYLREIIRRGWKAFYPIENYRNNSYQQKPRQQSQQPHRALTEEELRRQKEDEEIARQRREADEEWLRTCVF